MLQAKISGAWYSKIMVKTTSTKATQTAVKKTKSTPKKAITKPAIVEATEVPITRSGFVVFLREHGHAILAFVYAVQALVLLLLAKTYTIAVTTNYIAEDTLASSSASNTVFASASRHFMDINIGYATAAVLLLAAITHLMLAVIRKRDVWSNSTIIRHGRRVRWTGLTLSMAGIVVIVALFLGIRDIAALAAIKALIIAAGVVGYLADEHQVISRRILTFLAAVTVIVPVLILGLAAVHSGIYGQLSGLAIGAVAVLLTGLLLLLIAFCYATVNSRTHKFSRSAFISIVIVGVESAVIWQIFAGFLRA